MGAQASLENLVRKAALENGFMSAEELNPALDAELVKIGKIFFNSTSTSLNGNTSCQTCHLDRFGSADGIPNAIGVGGEGEGASRIKMGGAILPRNTLPLWGRGTEDFKILFWDGRIEKVDDLIISQFGENFPSLDPLVVAAHLPPLEIREMLVEDKFIEEQKTEKFDSANVVFSKIISELKKREPDGIEALADFYDINFEEITYFHVAKSIAEFIKAKFAIQDTEFHKFVFESGSLSEKKLRGAELFYGKGKCSVCHGGALFSDFKFHKIAYPQLGFGKNGFGIDYGRFNTTHEVKDLYKFRTPPLFDVLNTAPYSHSGSIQKIQEAIIFHFDPLRFIDLDSMTPLDRSEFYKRISLDSQEKMLISFLNDNEIELIVEFLKSLSFSPNDI